MAGHGGHVHDMGMLWTLLLDLSGGLQYCSPAMSMTAGLAEGSEGVVGVMQVVRRAQADAKPFFQTGNCNS